MSFKFGPLFWAQPKVGDRLPVYIPTPEEKQAREEKIKAQIKLAFKLIKKPGK